MMGRKERLEAAAAGIRADLDIRIARRLIAMRAEGFSERDLQREAALMRGASNVISIFEHIGSGMK